MHCLECSKSIWTEFNELTHCLLISFRVSLSVIFFNLQTYALTLQSRGEGLDLYEFTDALTRLNFYQAINLSGDGGRALIVRGSIVNSPRCRRGKGDPPCLERDDALLCLQEGK